MLLEISPEQSHPYEVRRAIEQLRDRVCWQGFTVRSLSALAEGILVGADTHMSRGEPLCPSELCITIREYARPGGDDVQIRNGIRGQ
jgi:hypothetical protein